MILLVARFETTNWSIVLKAASGGTAECREALSALCGRYWHPVYSFIRNSGANAVDAEDLTQAYFTRLLEKGVLEDVRPGRGRFRAFILVSLRNFLANERDYVRAIKRGGGRRIVSLDSERGEGCPIIEPADVVTPELVFERAWARVVLDQAFARLKAENANDLGSERFLRLEYFVTGEGPEASYSEIAREWAVGESAVRVAVHRLRRRFGKSLRDEVAQTVEDPKQVDAEIRHLLAVVGS
jgi:RNA polymerase sigma-70 factor (ECF subfamily)